MTLFRKAFYATLLSFTLGMSLPAKAQFTKKSTINKEKVAGFKSGELGAFLLSINSVYLCEFDVENVNDRKDVHEISLNQKLTKIKVWLRSNYTRYTVGALKPGKYRLTYGICEYRDPNQKITIRHRVKDWYAPFEVKANEVTYIGEIQFYDTSYNVDGVLDFVPDFIVRPPKDRYRVYTIENNLEKTVEAMNKKEKTSWLVPFIKENLLEHK